jgi:hypothetical protein
LKSTGKAWAEIATMLERDQKVAADISNEILEGFVNDQASLFRYIALQKENWKEDRIEIYTASGKMLRQYGYGNGKRFFIGVRGGSH